MITASVMKELTSYGFLYPCENLEKTNDTIPRKCPDSRTGGPMKNDKFNC